MHKPTDRPWNDDFDFAGFRHQVEEYGNLLRTAPSRDRRTLEWLLIACISGLYVSGTQMPPYSPFMPEDVDEESVGPDAASLTAANERRFRAKVLADSLRVVIGEDDDAYFAVDFPDEARVSQFNLSRELVLILGDLEEGAVAWDEGRHDDAAWTWTYGFEEGGWGEEALSVLVCLHYNAGERMSLLEDSPPLLSEADSAVEPER